MTWLLCSHRKAFFVFVAQCYAVKLSHLQILSKLLLQPSLLSTRPNLSSGPVVPINRNPRLFCCDLHGGHYGESKYSPPQDCQLGGQSVGGESWYPGISTLPTWVRTLFSYHVYLYHGPNSILNLVFYSHYYYYCGRMSRVVANCSSELEA